MAIVRKYDPELGDIAIDEEAGDYLQDVLQEFHTGGVPETYHYRFHRGEGRQLFEVRVSAIYPKSREKRIKLLLSNYEDQYKHGTNIWLLSNWGKYFPENEIDTFIERVYDFFIVMYNSRKGAINFQYKYPVTGKEFFFSTEEKNA